MTWTSSRKSAGVERPPNDEVRGEGPSIVAIGGGHGLAATLRAARSYAGSITGIVSVGDDGGSSGRLRAEFGVAPPGDLRRCLSALADEQTLLARSLEHRFADGTLTGHPIGNLLLIGLAFAAEDLQAAIDEVGRLVGAAGRVFPASEVPVTLIADSDQGTLAGQVTIERATGIGNLRFDPSNARSPAEAIKAVVEADQIVIGPGSLFTSVLACALMPDIRSALAETAAQRVFVANVANEKGDARGFGLRQHVEALIAHGVAVDVVLASDTTARRGPEIPGLPPILTADVAAEDGWSHDTAKLGAELGRLFHRNR